MVSPRFPEPPPSTPATPQANVDAALERLWERKRAWCQVDDHARREYLRDILRRTRGIARAWVEAACRAKGIDPASERAGEVWLSDPMPVLRNARQLIRTLAPVGVPRPPALRQRANGQWVAKVFPAEPFDKVLFLGFSGEIWIEKDKPPTQGTQLRRQQEGKVALVLGAGNIGSIGPMDALYKLFVENEVVLLKMNPVNDYIGPFLEEAFASLIRDGYFAVVYGGAEVGAYLTNHANVDTLHITGSDRTHDAIIWGASPDEQRRNKDMGTPVLRKPITSELGCVTPVLVVPGAWSERELQYQARHVASMVAHNASFNCNAAKALLLAKGWEHTPRFLSLLRQELAAIPPRKAYYPGAQERYQAFLDRYPDAEPLAERSDEVVPWTLLPGVRPSADEYALTTEAFCGVLSIVTVEATDARQYMQEAARVANDEIWGTLSCMVLIHPDTERAHRAPFDHFLESLRYGGIAINCWAGVVYGVVSTTWGAFPGHPLDDIRSGCGSVHNTYLFDFPERSVVRAPFVMRPTPPWFATHKNLRELGERLTDFEGAPSWTRLPRLLTAALKG